MSDETHLNVRKALMSNCICSLFKLNHMVHLFYLYALACTNMRS